MDEITFNKTKSSLSETLETIVNDYKVVSNITTEAGKMKRLSGWVAKVNQSEHDMMMEDTISWNASQRNGKWGVSFDWVSNDDNDELTDLVVAVVNKIVADYQAA